MQIQPSTTRCRRTTVVSLLVCTALVALSVLPEPADAYIRDSQVTDYAPNQPSYLAYISVWYMNSAQQVDGMRVWFLPPRIWSSTTYTGDLLATDYAGGIPITQSYDQNKKTLIVSGSGSVRQYNAVLMSVYFYTTNYYQAWRYFYWNLGASYYFWRWSARWYTWRVPVNPAAFLWDDAVADCQSQTYLGMTGYLATGENYWPNWFIYYYSYGVRSWLGAGDDTVTGNWWWRWIQGPYYSSFSGGQGLPFYGQTCVTQPVGSYYPPWFFPAWYQDMFPNIGNVPPSWATFMKACLKRFGSAQWCPDTPIQQMTTCATGCIAGQAGAGGFCNFATGYPTSQPPAKATSSPYANPSWQKNLPPNAKDVLPASWTIPQYKDTGRHRLMMQPNGAWTDQAASDAVGGYFCAFGGYGYWPPYTENGLMYTKPGCGFQTTPATCLSQPMCQWSPKSNSCVRTNCQDYTTVVDCRNWGLYCAWDVDLRNPNTCAKRYCVATFTDQTTCNRFGCLWQSIQQIPMCYDKMCTVYATPCTCTGVWDSQTRYCFWDAQFVAGTGKVGTCMSDLFALCTNLDFLFAYQTATTAIATTSYFQMVAAVEAVRRIYKHYPLSGHTYQQPIIPANANSGFRFSFIVWGPATTLAVPGTGTGGYNISTGSSDGWTFSTASSIPAYDRFTGDPTQINSMIDRVEDAMTIPSSSLYVNPMMTYLYSKAFVTTKQYGRVGLVMITTDNDGYSDTSTLNSALASQISLLGLRILITRTGANAATAPASPICNVLTQCVGGREAMLPGGDDIETWTHYTCYGGVTTWNQFTQSNSTRLGSCVFYSSQTQCDNDPKCQWYSDIRSNHAAQCWPSSCVSTYCTQASCAQNPQCYWNTTEQLCGRFVCPSYFNLTACLAVSTKWCAYDQTSLTPAGWFCRNKYCLTRSNFWSCINDEKKCVWDTTQNWQGVCRESYCPYTNETVCKQHVAKTANVSVNDTNVCVWETRFGSPKCRENSCIQYNAVYNSPQLESFCNNNGACKVYQNTTPVPATTYCDEDWCGAYPTEAYCSRDLLCTWDIVVSPSVCRETTCGRWSTQTLCDSSDVTCAWNGRQSSFHRPSRHGAYGYLCQHAVLAGDD